MGVVLNYLQHAVVQPLLKKPGLDESCLNNFVSKLSFLSNLLEKVVWSQSDQISLLFTESALLKVFTETFITLFAVDSGKNVLLMLLDLTTCF